MRLKAVLEVFFENITSADLQVIIGEKVLEEMFKKYSKLFTMNKNLTAKTNRELKQYLFESPFLVREMREVIRTAFCEYCEGNSFGQPRKKKKGT